MQSVVDEDSVSKESTREPLRPDDLPDAGFAGWVRMAFRAPSIFAATGGLYGCWVVGGTLLFVLPTARRKLRAMLFRLWGRCLLGIMGFEVEVRGQAPGPPCFLVGNHVSWVDIPLIASRFEGAFVAKAEIGSWPVAGTLSRSMNTIFVDRGRRRDVVRVNELVQAALLDQLGIVLFPEGGSTRGAVVQPFKSSLLEPATAGSHDVFPFSVHYEAPSGRVPASQIVCFWGDIGFAEHFGRLVRRPGGYRAVLTFGSQPIREEDRKELARRLHESVSESFQPIE